MKTTLNSLYYQQQQQHQPLSIHLNKQYQTSSSLALASTRGRGRPKRIASEEKLTKLQTNTQQQVNNLRNESPNISVTSDPESRSRSPVIRSTPTNEIATTKRSTTDLNSTSTTRTSTPSKLTENTKRLNYDDISNANEEEDTHTEVYSSIFDEEEDEDSDEEEEEETGTIISDCNLEEIDQEENEEELMVDDIENETDITNSTTNSTKLPKSSSKQIKSTPNKSKLMKNNLIPIKQSKQELTINNNNNDQSNRQHYDFTLQALEMSLFGYLRQQQQQHHQQDNQYQHAFSGIRIPNGFNPTFHHQQLLAKSNTSLFQSVKKGKFIVFI